MNEALMTIGSLCVTPFSVAVCAAAVIGCAILYFLSKRTHLPTGSVWLMMPLTVLLGLLFGHALYAVMRVLIYPLDYEAPVAFILNPGVGGFMFFGVLAGGALAAIIVSCVFHTPLSRLMSVLFPALMIMLTIIRFAEPLSYLGKGPEAAGGFFPLSYAPEADYPDDRYIPAFFYAGLYTLFIGIRAALNVSGNHKHKRTALFFFVLYLAGQMFFEVFRQDEYVNATSLITFVRLNQLFAAILLGICLVYAIIKGKSHLSGGIIAGRCAVFAVSVGACVGLQFLFDKPLPLFGETVWVADWLVYVLLALSAVGIGWSVLSLMKRGNISVQSTKE